MAEIYADANFLINISNASSNQGAGTSYLDTLTRDTNFTLNITTTVHDEVLNNLSGNARQIYTQWYFSNENSGRFVTALTPQLPGGNRGEESIVWHIDGRSRDETTLIFSSDTGADAVAAWASANNTVNVHDTVGGIAVLMLTGHMSYNEYSSITAALVGVAPAEDFLADDPQLRGLPKIVPGVTYEFEGKHFKILGDGSILVQDKNTNTILGVVNPNNRFDLTDQNFGSNFEQCFLAGTQITMADGSTKPIEEIKPNDWVMSFDKAGNKVPGRVTNTMTNEAKIILDFHGTYVTPGHVYYCAGGKYKGQFVPLIDILRDDGIVQHQDGRLIRASTGCEVGSEDDRELWAFLTYRDKDGTDRVKAKKKLRLGTRWMVESGNHFSMREYFEGIGVELLPSGYIRFKEQGITTMFTWHISDSLPNPEDFVLARSGTTLAEIYQASQWEAVRPQMPVPMVREGGPVRPLTERQLNAMPRNMPVGFENGSASSEILAEPMTRQQRRALARKEAKKAKAQGRQAETLH